MFFPIRTDRRIRHTPWINYTLIFVNVAVFILTQQRVLAQDPTIVKYYLLPQTPELMQFFTYQFLHADWMHLLGNMIFLLVFGNGVEDRFGKVGYALFYLAGGVIAGLVHAAFQINPVLGASGSIAGVTGAYLALFPRSNVTMGYWLLFFIGTFEISSMLLILFRICQDLLFQSLNIGGVAYLAHIGGYFYGFAIGMGLLLTRVTPREPYDMLSLIEQRRRRTQFQKLTRDGYHPWSAAPAGGPPVKADEAASVSPEQEELLQLRAAVSAAVNRHDLDTATLRYAELLERDPKQVMSQQHQLDLANKLMSDGQYDAAATAYELFLATYRSYPELAQVQLILGLIYARYLQQADRARELLTVARDKLGGPERELAESELDQLET